MLPFQYFTAYKILEEYNETIMKGELFFLFIFHYKTLLYSLAKEKLENWDLSRKTQGITLKTESEYFIF